jgi:hypothetical protein
MKLFENLRAREANRPHIVCGPLVDAAIVCFPSKLRISVCNQCQLKCLITTIQFCCCWPARVAGSTEVQRISDAIMRQRARFPPREQRRRCCSAANFSPPNPAGPLIPKNGDSINPDRSGSRPSIQAVDSTVLPDPANLQVTFSTVPGLRHSSLPPATPPVTGYPDVGVPYYHTA